MNKIMTEISNQTESALRKLGTSRWHRGNYEVIGFSNEDLQTHYVKVAYCGTVVVKYTITTDGTIIAALNNGGYCTMTTKNVINAALAWFDGYVYAKKFMWHVNFGDQVAAPYKNGMKLVRHPAPIELSSEVDF